MALQILIFGRGGGLRVGLQVPVVVVNGRHGFEARDLQAPRAVALQGALRLQGVGGWAGEGRGGLCFSAMDECRGT